MALNARLVGDLILKRQGKPDSSDIASIVMQIPQALKATARKLAADPSTRALLVSDRTTAKLAITAGGKVNLATGYTQFSFLKEFMDHGEIYHLPTYTFTGGFVNPGDDSITLAAGQRLAVGDTVRFIGGGLPGGLTAGLDYFVGSWDSATRTFILSPDVTLSSRVDITSTGSGIVAMQETADFPMQKLAGPGVAPYDRYLADIYRYYYIQGDTLRVLPAGSTGEVAFAVPTIPLNLESLPESTEAENIFLDTMMQLVTGNPN